MKRRLGYLLVALGLASVAGSRYAAGLVEPETVLGVSVERPTVTALFAAGVTLSTDGLDLVDPNRGQRTKNELSERILEAFNEHPDRVTFPVGRNRKQV